MIAGQMEKPRPRSPSEASSRRRAPDPNSLFEENGRRTASRASAAHDDDDDDDDDGGPEDMNLTVAAAPPSLPFNARLVVEKGDHAGLVLDLGGGVAAIGRSSKCELPLKGSVGVSRRHCKVQLVGQRYVVIDLESRNGTLVNGAPVERKVLEDGDLIEVGDERVRFVATAKAGQGRAPAPVSEIGDQDTALLEPEELEELRASLQPSSPSRPPLPHAAEDALPSRHGDTAPPLPSTTQSFVIDPATLAADAARHTRGSDRPALGPPPPLPAEPTSFQTERPPAAGRFGVMQVLLVVALVVVAMLGVAAWDIGFGDQHLLALVRGAPDPVQVKVPAPTAPRVDPPPVDPPKADALAQAEAPSADASKADPPISDGQKADGSSSDGQKADGPSVDAPHADDAKALAAQADEPRATPSADAPQGGEPPGAGEPPTGDAGGEAMVVAATAGGRIGSVRVKAGDVVKKGQVVALLEPLGGVRRKLDSLRAEERDFEAAVAKGNKAAKRDLESVRREIAELERRSRGASLTSDVGGVVVEVLVAPGDSVKSGAPVVKLQAR